MATPEQNRDRFRAVAARARSIPGLRGLRPHTVSIRLATSSGTHTGDGTISGDWTDITEADGQPPKVRWAGDEERAVGGLPDGTATIGPITPEFSGGGTTLDLLKGADAVTGDVLQVRITGPRHPNGALYRVLSMGEDRALHYTLQVAPVATT